MTTPVLWRDLRRFTTARVGLGRAGNAVPTAAHLDFQEAHARARDAVWSELDVAALQAACGRPMRHVRSQAEDRRSYLLRPDLGRRLRPEDGDALAGDRQDGGFALVLADGLCATGVQAQAPMLLAELVPALERSGWRVLPVVVATQARVALGDEVGAALGAAAAVVVIGERPGLSALDSVGIYLTWAPRPGRTDAERNCISNIRPAGLSARDATAKLVWLADAARRLKATGVALKDEQPAAVPELPGQAARLSSAP